ncbi:hypothetical protein [Pedobacter gandavensis]|uniref:Uncharacterized protein n=1 Tax=Pedobacter gandavensis TaxID=2679963 RepID=A0ABR6EU50_9SPHI|nr:hypothetical protein [Pedobacter gandavensis]MBB2148791.1 hypothetical protein [Pedobacter gandavensis]
MNIIERLKEIAEENPNGFTVYTTNLEPVKKGWIVAQIETQNCFGDEGLKKALEVALKTSQVLGGWKEEDLFYWDAVIIFNNEEEATRSGIENKQIAIYQIETNNLKFL